MKKEETIPVKSEPKTHSPKWLINSPVPGLNPKEVSWSSPTRELLRKNSEIPKTNVFS